MFDKSSFLATIVFFYALHPVLQGTEPSSTAGDLIVSERSRPLIAIAGQRFPDDGGVQRGLSAAVFVWPTDNRAVRHRANSVMARAALLQYAPTGGREAVSYNFIREQGFYVISGQARFTVNEVGKDVGPGDMIFVPSAVKCAYQVLGDEPLKMLLMEWRSSEPTSTRAFSATVISEKIKPLTRLSDADAGGHHGISATPFVTSTDYPTVSHKANSLMAWVSLQQYDLNPKADKPATEIHSHPLNEHAFYLLEGQAHVVMGDTEQLVGPGDFVFAPRHVKHGYRVVGDIPVKWLMISWASD